ncbi:hypothetical protein AB0C18_32175 [Nonomuraea muscovyensis]|uniref:hypothetical protein n=1 Tax=Nonomuraea muscovyensis TaxID=1124761 RepID=UPI0033C6A6D6
MPLPRPVRHHQRSPPWKLSRYRSALDAGGDPIEISSWINETKSERARLEGELKALPTAQRISVAEIRAMIEEVGDLVRPVSETDPDDKAELYTRLGLELTYYPEKQCVEARVDPEPPHVRAVCVRGASATAHTWLTAIPCPIHRIHLI